MNRAVPAERAGLWGCQVILTLEREWGEMQRGHYLGADPKVTELHLAPGVHQHIGRLHICLGEKTGLSILSWIIYTPYI